MLVVNTCSFIAPAQQESVDTILEMAEHKTYGRATRLVVTGCLVERYREQIMEQIPAVDAVIGTGEIERIVEAVTGGASVSAGTSSYPALTAQAAGLPRLLACSAYRGGRGRGLPFLLRLRGGFFVGDAWHGKLV